MKKEIYQSADEVAQALIRHIIACANEKKQGDFCIALSGGSTPNRMFELWAQQFDGLTPWDKMQFFWVDERCVPPTDADSNYGMASSLLFSRVDISPERVHRIIGEDDPFIESQRYERLVSSYLEMENYIPIFDMVLLGMGTDGHTSSIFPGSEELLTATPLYTSTRNPHNGQARIAMTGKLMTMAKQTIFLLTGGEKAARVKELFGKKEKTPAAYVAHHARETRLFMDSAAAQKID